MFLYTYCYENSIDTEHKIQYLFRMQSSNTNVLRFRLYSNIFNVRIQNLYFSNKVFKNESKSNNNRHTE